MMLIFRFGADGAVSLYIFSLLADKLEDVRRMCWKFAVYSVVFTWYANYKSVCIYFPWRLWCWCFGIGANGTVSLCILLRFNVSNLLEKIDWLVSHFGSSKQPDYFLTMKGRLSDSFEQNIIYSACSSTITFLRYNRWGQCWCNKATMSAFTNGISDYIRCYAIMLFISLLRRCYVCKGDALESLKN